MQDLAESNLEKIRTKEREENALILNNLKAGFTDMIKKSNVRQSAKNLIEIYAHFSNAGGSHHESAKNLTAQYGQNYKDFFSSIASLLEDANVPIDRKRPVLLSLINLLKEEVSEPYESGGSVYIANILGETLISFLCNKSCGFLAVSVGINGKGKGQIHHATMASPFISNALDKIVELAGGCLVIFSDASGSSRTFSKLIPFVPEGTFVYLVNGIRNPNTSNLMDVATLRSSIDQYNKRIDTHVCSNYSTNFHGLCGGSILSGKNVLPRNEFVNTASSYSKRGLIMVNYTNVSDESLSTIEGFYKPVHEDLKKIFVVLTGI